MAPGMDLGLFVGGAKYGRTLWLAEEICFLSQIT